MVIPAISRSFAVACTAGLLLCCLTVIWFPAGPRGAVLPSPGAVRSRIVTHTITPPDILAARIVARPLFDAHRRQAAVLAGRIPATAALPRLTGTLITQAGRLAIFAGTPRGAVLREGQTFSGMMIENIAAGRITLRANGRQFVLSVTAAAQSGSAIPILQIAERVPEGQHEE